MKDKTDNFELAETDVSDLAVGESEIIVTESGKTIDLLRTADGVEIYVDGELLETPRLSGEHGDHHGVGVMSKSIVVKCETDGGADEEAVCEDELLFLADGDLDIGALHADGEAHKVIIRRIERECISDEPGDCELEIEQQ